MSEILAALAEPMSAAALTLKLGFEGAEAEALVVARLTELVEAGLVRQP